MLRRNNRICRKGFVCKADFLPLTSPVTRPKRCKTVTSPDPRDKLCLICNHIKYQGDTRRFLIESSEVADRVLKAANFSKDEIHIRIIFLKETGDIWAKDIMYHNNCMTSISASFNVTSKNCYLTIWKILKKVTILRKLLTMWLVVWTLIWMVTHFRMSEIS